MTDRGSSPEPDYPWTRWHWSEEQTTRDPDHWNASNRSRSGSEDRDPNDDPYTYRRATPEPVQIRVTRRTYIDVDANRLTENDIPLPTRPRTLTENLRADRYARLHLIDQFRQAIGFLSFSAFLAALLSILYNVI